MARNLTGTLALGLCLITTTCWALYRVIDKGEWPSTWPKEGPNFFLGKEAKGGVVVHCPPEDESKTSATPSEPINADNYRQLLTHSTYIELVVDGKIIDLNRIPLSNECLVIDQRFNNPK